MSSDMNEKQLLLPLDEGGHDFTGSTQCNFGCGSSSVRLPMDKSQVDLSGECPKNYAWQIKQLGKRISQLEEGIREFKRFQRNPTRRVGGGGPIYPTAPDRPEPSEEEQK